jgi:hypothetical protein
MKTKKMNEGAFEQQELRFRREVARVNPALRIPAEDQDALDALDDICIFAPIYAKYQQTPGQIPLGACSVRHFPSNTAAKHAALYDMYWQVVNSEDPATRYWALQKEELTGDCQVASLDKEPSQVGAPADGLLIGDHIV